jgi:hypothetical protein
MDGEMCWWVCGTAAGAGCMLISFSCCADSTWCACGDYAACRWSNWFPLPLEASYCCWWLSLFESLFVTCHLYF